MQTLKLTKKYETYPEYKDSGVEWLGKIPKNWETRKLGQLAIIQTGGTPPMKDVENYDDNGTVWVKPDNLNGFSPVMDSKEKLSIKGGAMLSKISAGSVLVNCIGDIGKIGVAGIELFTNQQINSVTFFSSTDSGFGKYLLYINKSIFKMYSNSVVVSILSKSKQSAVKVVVPPINIQIKIAKYLDEKTTLIDQVIERKEKQIELLREEIISLAQNEQENGKGELMNIKHLVNLYQNIIKIDDYREYITLGLYNRGRGLFHKDALLGKDIGESEFSKVEPRDLIISGQFAWEGAVALASKDEKECVVSHRYYLLRDNIIKTEYLLALLMTKFGDHILNESSRGSAGRNKPLNIKILLSEKIRVPSKEVEEKIGLLLIKMNTARDNIKTSIKLLEEYKSSLISNVVTGKIKV